MILSKIAAKIVQVGWNPKIYRFFAGAYIISTKNICQTAQVKKKSVYIINNRYL